VFKSAKWFFAYYCLKYRRLPLFSGPERFSGEKCGKYLMAP